MESGAIPKHWRYLGLDLKSGYQANLCWSMIIVYGAIIIVTASITLCAQIVANTATKQIDQKIISEKTVADAQGTEVADSPDGSRSTGSIAMVLPENYPRGFVRNIKIIRENVSPLISTIASSHNDAHEPIGEMPISNTYPKSVYEESTAYGYGIGDSDDGLPPIEPFLPPIQHLPSTPQFSFRDRPEHGLIMLAAIYWPTIASQSDTGYVEIVLDIDTKGRIEWSVKKEQPKGKGFASALEDALIRSKFNPPTDENGEKISVRITLSSVICYNCPPLLESTVSNMEAVQLRRGR